MDFTLFFEDLIWKILTKMYSLKDIFKWMRVNKMWRNQLKTEAFCKEHSDSNGDRFLLFGYLDFAEFDFLNIPEEVAVCFDDDCLVNSSHHIIPKGRSDKGTFIVHASHDGILCLEQIITHSTRPYNPPYKVMLWNPATGVFNRCLPSPLQRPMLLRMGFHSGKIVRFSAEEGHPFVDVQILDWTVPISAFEGNTLDDDCYELKVPSWITKRNVFSARLIGRAENDFPASFWQGKLHWVLKQQIDVVCGCDKKKIPVTIISFDLEKHVCSVVDGPESCRPPEDIGTGVSRNGFILVYAYDNQILLWTTNLLGSWTEKRLINIPIPASTRPLSLLWVTEDKILLKEWSRPVLLVKFGAETTSCEPQNHLYNERFICTVLSHKETLKSCTWKW